MVSEDRGGVCKVYSGAAFADAGQAQSHSHRAEREVAACGDGRGDEAEADSLCAAACPDFDDPEGWMREHPSYWADLAASSVAPSRAAWLRHGLVAALEALRRLGRGRDHVGEARMSKAQWSALFEAELALLRVDVADVADAADAADGGEPGASVKRAGDSSSGPLRFALDAPSPGPYEPQHPGSAAGD